MLALQVERIRRAQRIDELVIATSTDVSDDPLVDLCREAAVELFRGSLNDVLDRVYQAAKAHAPAHVVRLTGDCPLTDPVIIDDVIEAHLKNGSDYTSNALTPTFPDGLDVEVVRFECLVDAWTNAGLLSEREHVTPYLYSHPERFRSHSVTASVDRSHLRWTVDEGPDLDLVTRIFEALYPTMPRFGSDDVYRLLEAMPELKSINSQFSRNEGYGRSLHNERTSQGVPGGRR